MSNWSRFKSWLARGALKAAGISFVPQWVRYSVFEPTFRALVREGLKANSVVQSCVFLLARTFPEPELWPWAHDGTEYKPLPNHPLRKLMRRPNPDMGEAEFLAYVIVYCSLGGNIYLWKQRSAAGRVVALWPLHDGQMQPIAGRDTSEGLVRYYELDAGDGRKIPIPKEDVIQWKWLVDPEYPWRGMGALVAAAADVDTSNEIRAFVFSLLKNDATPPVVVTLIEGEEVTPSRTRRLRAEWKQSMGGENRGTPAFLEAGMTVQRMALTLNEMKFDSLNDGPEAAICAGFGIQPAIVGALVGLKNSGIQANFEEARKMLTELTLIPLWRAFASEVGQAMVGEMGYEENTAVRFDLGQVRSLQENQDALWQRAQKAYDGNLITRAEGRAMVGLATSAADEVYKEGLAMVLVPAGQMPAPRMDEAADEGGQAAGNGGKGWPLPAQWWTPLPGANGDGHEPVYYINGHNVAGNGVAALAPVSIKAPGRVRRRELVEARGRVRERVIGRAETAIDAWFEELADEVMSRLATIDPAATPAKELLAEDWDSLLSLLFNQQGTELERLLKRYALEVVELSWPFWNLELESVAVFDVNDPAVVDALRGAGVHIRGIVETTRTAVSGYLQEGYRDGRPIEEMARRVHGLVAETYKNRGRAIARTEVGTAQNVAGHGRYRDAGVQHVEVFDNGFDNSHDFCRRVAGQIVTLDWSRRNPLQHPNCVRAFGAVFDYQGDIFTEEVPWG